tara:strand:+ start:1327 stop:1644 length:318 start_codon:yes stop_codon:yes gene_type:complete
MVRIAKLLSHYVKGIESLLILVGEDWLIAFVRNRDSMILPCDSLLIEAASEEAYGVFQSSFETEEEAYYVLEPFLKRWEAGEYDEALEGFQRIRRQDDVFLGVVS